MNIIILGTGAMGSLFGARLHPFAHVTLFGQWAEQLTALQQHGLWLEDAHGRGQHIPLHATNDPTAVPAADLALILVKSHQTGVAAHHAHQFLRPNGIALTLQNGLGNLEQLTAILGIDRVAVGITSAGATMLGPGRVRQASHGHTYLAAAAQETAVPLPDLVARFQQAGFPTDPTSNPTSLLWGKLAVNAGINPLTALLGTPNGYLLQDPQAHNLMCAAAQETAVVAQAHAIQLPYADAAERVQEVAHTTAHNHSSMLQDVQRGSPTEIEAINGMVLAYGRRAGIQTPVNQLLWQAVRQIDSQAPVSFIDPATKAAHLYAQWQHLKEQL